MKYFSTLVVNPKENNPPALLTCISDSQIANYFLFLFFLFSLIFFSDWLFSFKLIIFLFNLFPKKKLLKTKTQQYKKKQNKHRTAERSPRRSKLLNQKKKAITQTDTHSYVHTIETRA